MFSKNYKSSRKSFFFFFKQKFNLSCMALRCFLENKILSKICVPLRDVHCKAAYSYKWQNNCYLLTITDEVKKKNELKFNLVNIARSNDQHRVKWFKDSIFSRNVNRIVAVRHTEAVISSIDLVFASAKHNMN